MNGFDLRTREGLTYFVCQPLEAAGFVNAFSTRLDDTSSSDFALGHSSAGMAETVAENRKRFVQVVGGGSLLTARQVHSAIIQSAGDPEFRSGVECDAITASSEACLVGIQTADCLPILVGDTKTGAFAGIHAGWRGTLKNIAAASIARMCREWGSSPDDMIAALGPAISAERFQLGPEVLRQFKDEYPWADELIQGEDAEGKACFDLNECNRRQLIAAGMRGDRIFDSGLCTIGRNDLFFSYRFEKGNIRDIGRLMSVVGRKPVLE